MNKKGKILVEIKAKEMFIMYYIVPDNTFKDENKVKSKIKDYSEKWLPQKNLYLNLVSSNKNGLLYELDYSKYTDKTENIGDIMLRFSEILRSECNIYLAIYCGSLDWFNNGIPKNFVYLTEEILFENMTLDEKKKKLSYYLEKIDTNNKELLIIDAYLFPKNCDEEYKLLLKSLLKESGFSKLKVITNKSSYNDKNYHSIVDGLEGEIKVYFSNKYHDRYWITDYKKGFSTGSSLNGIGKKVCRINSLDDTEVEAIVENIKDIISENL